MKIPLFTSFYIFHERTYSVIEIASLRVYKLEIPEVSHA